MTRTQAAEALRAFVQTCDEHTEADNAACVSGDHNAARDAITLLAQEDPSKDGAQGATPAYWRGFYDGQAKAANLLMHVLSEEPIACVAFLDSQADAINGPGADLLRVARAVMALRGRRAGQ